MTDQHPITPPPELRQQWINEAPLQDYSYCIIKQAARWGYDQRSKVNEAELQQARDEELEACRMEIIDGAGVFLLPPRDRVELANDLRAARRPKPPILKEQAIEDFESLIHELVLNPYVDLDNLGMKFKVTNILRALEAVPDD